MAILKDSGARREFETGAVRDIQEGKGRCDLLPLDVIADIYREEEYDLESDVLNQIDEYQKTGLVIHLYRALSKFIEEHEYTGWSDMFLDIAKHFEDGARKYGDNNWRKGIPTRCYIDSAVRHYLKWLRGDEDEPHDRAFAWNILCCIWTAFNKPELDDYRKED